MRTKQQLERAIKLTEMALKGVALMGLPEDAFAVDCQLKALKWANGESGNFADFLAESEEGLQALKAQSN